MPATRHVNPATATLIVVTSDPSCVRTRLLNIVPRDPHVLAASIGVVASIPYPLWTWRRWDRLNDRSWRRYINNDLAKRGWLECQTAC
jgi:hypothetical protein